MIFQLKVKKILDFIFYLFCWGQLHILNFDPNSSPSSNVFGKCFHKVSGKNKAVMPPITERAPIMTKGKT